MAWEAFIKKDEECNHCVYIRDSESPATTKELYEMVEADIADEPDMKKQLEQYLKEETAMCDEKNKKIATEAAAIANTGKASTKATSTKRKASSIELATLALAKAIAEGDSPAAKIAMDAGAIAEAFWIDGVTTLQDLANQRAVDVASSPAKAPSPKNPKARAAGKKDEPKWTLDFLVFAAMRGYDFDGQTDPVSRIRLGSPIRPINSVKAAVRLIERKHDLIRNPGCIEGKEGEPSAVSMDFAAEWKGDKRVVGFDFKFKVDATEAELWKMFVAAKKAGRLGDLPSAEDHVLDGQKNWEGDLIALEFFRGGYQGLDDILGCLRKGGSPFFKYDGEQFGEFGDSAEDKAFMDTLREELGQQKGWHRRIGPFLTPESIEAIKAKAAAALAAPKSKTATSSKASKK